MRAAVRRDVDGGHEGALGGRGRAGVEDGDVGGVLDRRRGVALEAALAHVYHLPVGIVGQLLRLGEEVLEHEDAVVRCQLREARTLRRRRGGGRGRGRGGRRRWHFVVVGMVLSEEEQGIGTRSVLLDVGNSGDYL